jgi:ribose transport system substrate-binding protein
MERPCSLVLILSGKENEWTWMLLHRNANQKSMSSLIQAPQKFSLVEILSSLNETINLCDIYQLRSWGIRLTQTIFPSEILTEIRNYSSGDIMFSVPAAWEDVPFELCYLPDKGFLGHIFTIGTIVSVSSGQSHKQHTAPAQSMFLIIACQNDTIPSAYRECITLKNMVNKYGLSTHCITETDTLKALNAIERSAIVHFAGHSVTSGPDGVAGWEIGKNRYFTIVDILKLEKNPFVPHCVFSNSCQAGTCGAGTGMSGIAGAFLKAGIPIVIGPLRIINDKDALQFALCFYQELLKKHFFSPMANPSHALLVAKQTMLKHNPQAITPLLYRLFGDPNHEIPLTKIAQRPLARFFQARTMMLLFSAGVLLMAFLGIGKLLFFKGSPVYTNAGKRIFTYGKAIVPGNEIQPPGTLPADNNKCICYLAPPLIDEFQIVSKKSIEETFSSIGYTIKTYSALNSARQLCQFDSAMALKPRPKAIILAAVDFSAVEKKIKEAQARNIPVIAYDRLLTCTVLDFTSIAATVEIGQIAAGKIAELLDKKFNGAKGKVLQILGDPQDNYTIDIGKGYEECIQKYPGIYTISKYAFHWDTAEARTIAETQLTINPDIDLVYVHAAFLAVPVVSALQAKGKKPGEIMIVSSNGAPAGLQLIRDGWSQCEVEQPLYAQVHGMANFINAIVDKDTINPGVYDVFECKGVLTRESFGLCIRFPGRIITKENVDKPWFWGNHNK